MKQLGYKAENTISADDVAHAMIDVITSGKYGGGRTIKIAVGGTRVLDT